MPKETWTVVTEELDDDERRHLQARQTVSPEDYTRAFQTAVDAYEQANEARVQAKAILDSFTNPQEESHA